ncbi:MAG: hypothetical protein K2N05_12060 [Muribaculaceae bacterium]|nr:hypothetical protein [Muribaculaceae bacterium]
MKLKELASVSALLLLASCGWKQEGAKKFAPTEKQAVMTDSEREVAIAEKRNSLASVDTALIFGNPIKLTIMKPKPEGAITEQISDLVKQKMLDMVTANGIGGVGGDPAMVFACGISKVSKNLTGTAPQKTQVTLEVQYYVANVASGTVFGSLSDKVVGVGNNEESAYRNACSELKNTPAMQQMLKKASEKIIEYYNSNASSIQAEVEGLIAKNEYEQAYALLRGVPEQCKALFEFSSKRLPSISQKLLERDAATNLAHMQAAMAANSENYADVVGDIMALIPVNTPQYSEAKAAFGKYLTDLDIKADKRAKIEAEKADAEHRRKMEQLTLDAKLAHDAAVDGRWDKGFDLVDKGIDCVRDIGVTFGRNSSWTSFLNPSNLVSSVSEIFN